MTSGDAVDVDDEANGVDIIGQNILKLLHIVVRKTIALGQQLIAHRVELCRLVEGIIVRGILRRKRQRRLIGRVGIKNKEPDCGKSYDDWQGRSASWLGRWLCGRRRSVRQSPIIINERRINRRGDREGYGAALADRDARKYDIFEHFTCAELVALQGDRGETAPLSRKRYAGGAVSI